MNIIKNQQIVSNVLNEFSKTVASTLGPKGKNVLIMKNGEPTITKDGVSVASNITSNNPTERMIIDIIKKSASNTAIMAGDGTTTSTLLTEAIYNSLSENDYLEVSNKIPQVLEDVLSKLKKYRKKVNNVSSKFIKQVALTSSNYDKEITDNVIKAIKLSGEDGVIIIEPADFNTFEVKKEDAYEFNGICKDPRFFNKADKVLFENAYVFVSERKLTKTETLYKLLTLADKVPLVIVCPKPDNNVLEALLLNRANRDVVWLDPESWGQYLTEDLHDLAIMTGAKLITPETSFASIDINSLGKVKKIWADMEITKLELTGDTDDALKKHISVNRAEMRKMTSEYNLDKKRKRLAKLTKSTVRLIIGHPNNDILREKRDRVDDCIHAVKAALKHGYIKGGSNDLVRALKDFQKDYLEKHDDVDFKKDVTMQYISALHAPFAKILSNAGLTPEELTIILGNLFKNKDKEFNPVTMQYEDFYKSNIVDPYYVTECALRNATNVALLLLSTEYIVPDNDEIRVSDSKI
jgi:chaperonin GroEL